MNMVKLDRPLVRSVLLCKYASFDEYRRWTLIGIFGYARIKAPHQESCFAFVELVNWRGASNLKFQFEDPAGKLLVEKELSMSQYVDSIYPVGAIAPLSPVFSDYGVHQLKILTSDQVIATYDLPVVMLTDPGPG